MKMYRVTWHFKSGAAYTIPFGSEPPGGLDYALAEWEAPFPMSEYMKGDEDFWPIGDMRFINGVLVEEWPEAATP